MLWLKVFLSVMSACDILLVNGFLQVLNIILILIIKNRMVSAPIISHIASSKNIINKKIFNHRLLQNGI